MTAPRFTPGPWRFVQDTSHPFTLRVMADDGWVVARAHVNYSRWRGAGPRPAAHVATGERQFADLRMCAASPALYAALEAMVADCAVHASVVVMGRALAALAAARGGQ